MYFLFFDLLLSMLLLIYVFSQTLFNGGFTCNEEPCGFLISSIKNKKYKLDLNVQQRKFSQQTFKINSYYISGLVDAEGSFIVQIYKDNKIIIGWRVKTTFTVVLHSKDKMILEHLQSYWNIEKGITKHGINSYQFRVSSIKDLSTIIEHFDKYPLITQKCADYKLFKQVFDLMVKKEHLTEKGLLEIISIKSSMNNGLSDELKVAFPNITPVQRPVIITNEISDPNWLAGFTDGDGSFFVRVIPSLNYKTGAQILLTYKLSQHRRDIALMQNLTKYLDCGKVQDLGSGTEACAFTVSSLKSLEAKIIPFFFKISSIRG